MSAGFPLLMNAGTPPPDFVSNHGVSISITEAEGGSWYVDMSGILGYNSSTGALEMPAAGSVLGEGWEWAKVDVFNSSTGLFEQKDAVKWHTAERNEDNSAWRSTFTFYATGNVDPFMSYAISARNNTGIAQAYVFNYGESIVPPVSGAYSLYADIAGSLTNSVAGTTAKITPLLGDADGDGLNEIQVLRLSTDNGATFFNAGADVGPGFETSTAAGTSSYGVYANVLSGNSALPLNYWEIETRFSLSPGRDAAALSGFVEILEAAAIPEPSSYAIVFGALVLGGIVVRRRSFASLG